MAGGSSFQGSFPPNGMVNSESLVVVKPGNFGVVIGYQVDGFIHSWSAEFFVAWSHIYPAFMG